MTHINLHHIPCKYCGKTWGEHYGKYCLGWRAAGSLFCPKGYTMNDLCKNCGKALSEHGKHFYCYEENLEYETFQKADDHDDYLPEELFTI